MVYIILQDGIIQVIQDIGQAQWVGVLQILILFILTGVQVSLILGLTRVTLQAGLLTMLACKGFTLTMETGQMLMDSKWPWLARLIIDFSGDLVGLALGLG